MFTIDFSDHTGLVETSWFDQIDQLLTFAKKKENIIQNILKYRFNNEHPFNQMRLKLTTELLLNANLLSPEQIVQPRIATDDELMLIHKYDSYKVNCVPQQIIRWKGQPEKFRPKWSHIPDNQDQNRHILRELQFP